MTAQETHLREMLKHLPPSGASLRLLDLSGPQILAALQAHRPDIDPVPVTAPPPFTGLELPDDHLDAVTAYQPDLAMAHIPEFLQTMRRILRPGGRLILFEAAPSLQERAALLQEAGFARILTESVDGYLLSRGEKPYPAGMRTTDRVAVGAGQASTAGQLLVGQAVHDAPGRYLHLLIRQTPNKPAWKIQPGEKLTWKTAALPAAEDSPLAVLAFSSLPKAVAFMQAAVMAGTVTDVSKIARFSQDTGATWPWAVLLNPTLEQVKASGHLPVTWLDIDPATAEEPTE